MLYGWKENSMLTNCLAACTHVSSTVSQLFEPQVQKIAVFTYTAHIFVIARQHTDARYRYSNSVRPSLRLSVRPSVTSRYWMKAA